MNNNDYNLLCDSFQEKIITVFNECELPFLVKFFLFKEIWKTVKKQKYKNDLQVNLLKSKKKQTLSSYIPLQKIEEIKEDDKK